MGSVKRIIEEKRPQVICITETMLGENEKIDFEGYVPYYNSNKAGQGG